MFLFTPEPRKPATYAEACLDHALVIFWPGLTWDALRERGLTDLELNHVVSECVFGLNKAWKGGPDSPVTGWDAWGGAQPRFWAVTQADGWTWSLREPDYQGAALLNAVRELRGIWRPA